MESTPPPGTASSQLLAVQILVDLGWALQANDGLDAWQYDDEYVKSSLQPVKAHQTCVTLRHRAALLGQEWPYHQLWRNRL